MPLSSYSYEGEFLNPFCNYGRNLVTQMFCAAVRKGVQDPVEVVEWVRQDRLRRIEEGLPEGYQGDTMENLWYALGPIAEPSKLAVEFAEFIIAREKLPKADRERLKRAKSVEYREQWYREQAGRSR